MHRTPKRRMLWFLGRGVVLLGACLVALPPAVAWEPSGNLEIHYINVGQGGCTLIIGPN